MTHVSQKAVSKKVLGDITKQLFSSIQDKKIKSKAFLENLLTETEQVMIAKRLATVLMLIEEVSYYKISKTLKVSTSTIKRLHQQLLMDEFNEIEKWFKVKKNREIFWSEMENVLRMGLPGYTGKRWSILSNKNKSK